MDTVNITATNSIVNKFMSELRDKNYQVNRALFRNNIERIGEIMAYEISKTFDYEMKEVETPLGTSRIMLPSDDIVLATVLRAGLPRAAPDCSCPGPHTGVWADHRIRSIRSDLRQIPDWGHRYGIHSPGEGQTGPAHRIAG